VYAAEAESLNVLKIIYFMKAKKKGFDTQLASGCIKIKPLVCMGYQRSTN